MVEAAEAVLVLKLALQGPQDKVTLVVMESVQEHFLAVEAGELAALDFLLPTVIEAEQVFYQIFQEQPHFMVVVVVVETHLLEVDQAVLVAVEGGAMACRSLAVLSMSRGASNHTHHCGII